MARPMKPLVRSGGYYPSNRWIPLVYPGGYTTMNSGGEPTPSVVWVTVSGASPLPLVNAAASNIRSLTQTGKCVQNGTPTPEAPVDIVCNNGVLRLVHRSGLPSGYKLLEYVGSSGAAYVVTDVFLASTDVVEAEFRNSSTTGYGALYGVFRLGDSSALYANQTYYGYDESSNRVDTDLRVNTDWHSSRHDFVNGTLTIDDTTVTFTPFEFANSVQNAVLARYYNNSYGYIWKGFIRKFKVTRGGEVICDLLPAKNEQDEAGLYDLISGTFYTATGGTLVAGDEVNDYEPAVVGTDEILSLYHNARDAHYVQYLNAYLRGATRQITAYNGNSVVTFDCEVGQTYRCFDLAATGNSLSVNVGFSDTIPGIGYTYSEDDFVSIPVAGGYKTNGLVFTAIKRYATFIFRYDGDAAQTPESMLEQMLFVEVAQTQTATVVDLYAVGDYRDEVDVVAGTVTRRVGIYVFTGEEDFFLQTGNGNPYFRANFSTDFATSTSNGNGFCTHFPCGVSIGLGNTTQGIQFWKYTAGNGKTSVGLRCDDLFTATSENITPLKTWLAAQYAAGTPVIVFYPLAEATTEQTTPQPLRTEAGDNTVSVVSEVDPVKLSVEYAQGETASNKVGTAKVGTAKAA